MPDCLFFSAIAAAILELFSLGEKSHEGHTCHAGPKLQLAEGRKVESP
jgi:hypothetical protein